MIIVTGAAGLIGGAVVRELNRRGRDDLILVDHLGMTDKWMNLRSLRYIEYIERDDFAARMNDILYQSRDSLSFGRSAIDKIDAIIHLGACSATTERNATFLIENNYKFSVDLAKIAMRYSARMVYASSAATYGDGEDGFEDDENQMHGLRPLNMYGYSKHMFDLWLAREGFSPLFAGLKYFNVFGANEYHKGDMMSLVLKAYRQIVADGKIRLFKSHRPDYKDGEQMRDFFYVEDSAKMTVFLTLDNPNACGLFNAGSGVASTWVELATAIFDAMSLKPNIEFIEMPEHLRDRYQYYTCAPIKKIRDAGFTEPVTELRLAVKDYVQNYLMQNEKKA
jgi:ADP-L-glycero-D-manno-heptose 6-epimerase